jgi:hypothetical protein
MNVNVKLPEWLCDPRLDVVIDWDCRWAPDELEPGHPAAAWEMTWFEDTDLSRAWRVAPIRPAAEEEPEPFGDEGPLPALRDKVFEILDGRAHDLAPGYQVQLAICGWALVYGQL